MIHKNGNWVYKNKKNVIEDMVDNGYNMLDCYLEDDKIIIHDKKRKNFIEFQNQFESIPRIKKELYLNTELEILNGIN